MTSVAPVASIYKRGKRLWGRLKDDRGKWTSQQTPYNVGEEDKAKRYIATAQKSYDKKRPLTEGGPPTVELFAERWLADRKSRKFASVGDDVGRINNHVLPRIGSMLMQDVRPKHVRDMVRDLCKTDLAPRTIRNTFGIMHAMFRDAVVEEVIPATPCVLARGELPGKTDKDPEWRPAATYTLDEVKALVDNPIVPVERRLQYAFKALAGLRHGEVAGLRWRHYDPAELPLGRLLVATSYNTGRTKTEVVRRIPVHPVLAEKLAAWQSEHWPAIYGRKPKGDDLLVPTRNQTPVQAAEAGHAMTADLLKLDLRVEAGKKRKRGGHDLRAWFITSCQEGGAQRDLLRVITHTSKSDVMDGYTRSKWAALCDVVTKLQLHVNSRGSS